MGAQARSLGDWPTVGAEGRIEPASALRGPASDEGVDQVPVDDGERRPEALPDMTYRRAAPSRSVPY